MNLGEASMEQGELGIAKGYIRGGLVLCREVGSHWDICDLLELMASEFDGFERTLDAARLFGAASAQRDLLGTPLPRSERKSYEERVERVRRGMGRRFEELWEEGRRLGLEAAIDCALS